MNEFVNYFNDPNTAWHDDVSGKEMSHKSRQRSIIHSNRYDVVNSLLPQKSRLNFLDFACGSGDYLLDRMRLGDDGYGVDPAANLIEIARGEAAKRGLPTDRWIVGGLEDWPDRRFDVILAMSVMVFLSDDEEKAFFAKARRHLTETGVVICNFYNLFADLGTFNEFTVDLVLGAYAEAGLIRDDRPRVEDLRSELEAMLPFATRRSAHRGGSARGTIPFRGRNPFTLPRELADGGFAIDDGVFTRFHLLPPEVVERPENLDLFERQARHAERYREARLGPYFANNLTVRLRPC